MNRPEERRKFVRLNALVDVIYEKYPPQQKEKLSLTRNISKGGICLIAYEPLKESDMLGLKMYLPNDKKEVNALGKVVWSKEFIIGDDSFGKRYDVGVEFVDVKDEDLSKIDKYVFSRI